LPPGNKIRSITHPHPVLLLEGEGVMDKDNSIRTTPGRPPVFGMGLSKYTVGTSEGIIALDYITIGDKNQVRRQCH
jgi:hypothetical protein